MRTERSFFFRFVFAEGVCEMDYTQCKLTYTYEVNFMMDHLFINML